MNRQESQPKRKSILTRRMTRRTFNQGALNRIAGLVGAGIVVPLIGEIACGPDGKPLKLQPPTPAPSPEPSLNPELEPQIPIEILPNGLGEIFLDDATPRNLVVRKGGTMTVAGITRRTDGSEDVALRITDPLRESSDYTPRVFEGILPISSFSDILSANGGRYNPKRRTVSLPNGQEWKLQELNPATFETIKGRIGVFFIDRDPLRKNPDGIRPLHQNPVVIEPTKTIAYKEIKQSEDGRVLALDGNGNPVSRAISQRNGEWRWAKTEHLINRFSPSELSDAIGYRISALGLWQNLRNAQYVETFLSIANVMKIGDPLFDKNLFNASIDWRKILDNWQTVQTSLVEGKIPYESEVFNPVQSQKVRDLLDFAEKHHIPVIGSQLYWWSNNIDSILSDRFTPEEKRRMKEFMTKAKVLKYKDRIKEWIAISEPSYNEMPWATAQVKTWYNDLGGRQGMHDTCVWVKDVYPEAELTVIDTYIIDANNHAYRQHRQAFFDILNYLKQKGTPIDKVAEENNFWIYAPPTKDDVRNFLRMVKSMGYRIGASEMTIATGETFPIWKERPRTVQSVANKEETQAKVLGDTLEPYLEESGDFGVFSGTDYDTWYNYGLDPNAQPEITDKNGKAKLAYYKMIDLLEKRLS